jgi:hypothetical protein
VPAVLDRSAWQIGQFPSSSSPRPCRRRL